MSESTMRLHGRLRFYLVFVTGLLLGMVLFAPGASVAASVPEFKRKQVYFNCVGSTRVANLNYMGPDEAIQGWNDAAPSQPLGPDNGCAYLDPGGASFSTGPRDDGVWRGDFIGNLKSLTGKVYIAYAGPGTVDDTIQLKPILTVDGQVVSVTPAIFKTPVVAGNSAGHKVVEFAIVGLSFTEDFDKDGKPDAGPGTKHRNVELRLANLGTSAHTWLFDASEVPSGIVFNPSAMPATIFNAG